MTTNDNNTKTTEEQAEENVEGPPVSRRDLIRGTATVGLVGVAGATLAAGSATAAPSGTFPESSDDPLLKIRADRVEFVARTTSVSSPSDGLITYRSDL